MCILFLHQQLYAQFSYKELQVDYESIWTYKNLQLIPVKFKQRGEGAPNGLPAAKGPLSFSEALLKHKINVEEIQYKNGADANWLQVTNKSNQNIIIQSGEIVEGGKQDRMIAETKFIAPGKTDYLNVFCIEKRRWDKNPKSFKHRGVGNSKVRKAMDVSKRQSQVWKEIDNQFAEKNKKSETWSYLQLENAATVDTGYIRYFTKKYIEDTSNIAGFIFITGNQIISTEIFATEALLKISFDQLLSSYVQTVVTKGAPPKVLQTTVTAFMDNILLTEEAQKKYIAEHGKIFFSDGRKIHLVAYGN
jgi:hypothetical protein